MWSSLNDIYHKHEALKCPVVHIRELLVTKGTFCSETKFFRRQRVLLNSKKIPQEFEKRFDAIQRKFEMLLERKKCST